MSDTTDTARFASYLDLHLEIDNDSQLELHDKRDYFNFPIVSFRFICSKMSPTYGVHVYISQLIRYSRACGSFS